MEDDRDRGVEEEAIYTISDNCLSEATGGVHSILAYPGKPPGYFEELQMQGVCWRRLLEKLETGLAVCFYL